MSFTNLGFTNQTPLDPATANVWGTVVNENFTLIDSALAGQLPLDVSASVDIDLTEVSGAPDQARNVRFLLTGAITDAFTIYFPIGRTQQFSVSNQTSGTHNITIAVGTSGGGASGGTYVVPQAGNALLNSDGTNITQTVDLRGIGTSTASGIVGDVLNASMSNILASTLGSFTADLVVVGTALNGVFFELSSYSQSINLGTVGAGGMDHGNAPISGFVALYAIYSPGAATASILAQDVTSIAAPTIYGGTHAPSGYTASCLIGIWPTDASRNFAFGVQYGRSISITSKQIGPLTSATYATVSIASVIPVSAISCDGSIVVLSSSGASAFMAIAAYGAGTSAGVGEVSAGTLASGDVGVSSAMPFSNVRLKTSQTLYYRVSGTGSLTGAINISGYSF